MSTRVEMVYTPNDLTDWIVPLFQATIPAGKPESIDEPLEGRIDFNKYLIKHPNQTFAVRAAGDSMEDAGINPGDLLVVDRAQEPSPNSVVIVDVDGELTVKRLSKVGKRLWLIPDNKSLRPKEILGEQKCNIWGVVTYVIKKL
ncbi:MAG TPA: translesion error-prone DNA polymerase V autoproteolytic subunit [Pyrinomonadaceae bacterium]|jgi:DNA polymerase V